MPPWIPRAATRACWYLLVPALVALYFGPAILQGYLLAPGDGIAQIFPSRLLAADALRRGEMPFWNPYLFGGMPLFATIHPGVLFPGNWMFLALPPVAAMNVAVLLAYVLAGGGVLAFAAALGWPMVAGAAAATVFMFSGFMAYHVEVIDMIQAAAFMPWLLWAVERFRLSARTRYPLAGAGLITLMILAGHPQMAAYSLMVAGAYAVFRAASLSQPRGPYFLQLALMVVVGIGMSLAQLWPTLDLIQVSQRAVITYERLIRSSLDWMAIPGFFSPFMFGTRAVDGLVATPLWAPDAWLGSQFGYVGPVAMALGLAGLASWRADPRVRFWAVVGAIAFVLAFGGNTPLYRLWAMLPVVNQMPFASRHLLEFDFAVAMLVGHALAAPEAWLRRWWLALMPVAAACLTVIAALAALGPGFAARTAPFMPAGIDLAAALHPASPALWLPLVPLAAAAALLAWGQGGRAPWKAGLVAMVAVDLMIYGAYMGRYHDGKVLPPDFVADVRRGEHEGRSLGIARVAFPYFEPMSYLQGLRYPGMSAIAGVRTVNGYDAFIFARLARLTGMESLGHLADEAVWQPGHHVLDLMGLREVRLDPEVASSPTWRERLAGDRFANVRNEDGLIVAENRRGLPRAWRPDHVISLPEAEVDRRLTADPSFRPEREALVEVPLPSRAWTAGSAAAESVSLNRLRLSTDGPGPGLVVVSEGYDPGWQAFIDDRELPVRRVDGLLLGIEVPAGPQAIELRYEPRRWRQGLAGSGLALIALVAWGYMGRSRRRSRR